MESTANKSSGLLQKARNYLAENTPNFQYWVKRIGLKRACILSPAENCGYYCISDSFGFKAREIARLFETKEFWYNTISKAFEWQCFSKDFNELDKFSRFFPDDFFSSVNKIFFLPFFDRNEPQVFVTIEFEEDTDIVLPEAHEAAIMLGNIYEFKNNEKKIISKLECDISVGLDISNSRLYILSLKNCIENELKDIPYPSEEIKQNTVQFLTENAQTLISHLFRSPNCSHSGLNGEIKIALYAKDAPEEQLLAHHIGHTLTNLFEEESTANILLLPAGEVTNIGGTVTFLTKG